MANTKELKATALAVITFIVRPSIFLLLGLVAGYALGFSDAFRESDTIGDKASRVIYSVHPAALSDGVRARAEVLRDTVHKQAGLAEVPPS